MSSRGVLLRTLRRYARTLLTQELKQKMHNLLGYGLALEGLAASHKSI
jgi:hypothetical protein